MSEQRLTLTLHDLAFAVEGDLDGVSDGGRAVMATILRQDPRLADPPGPWLNACGIVSGTVEKRR